MKRALQIFGLVFVVMWIALPAGAQPPNYNTSLGSPTGGAIHPPTGFPFPVPPLDPRVRWTDSWLCRAAGPAEVVGFRVLCAGATFLDFHVADCCIPGDHWQYKGKAWDVNPNTGVTTAPGPAGVYSVPGRTYNYGGTPVNPGGLDAYVECSYLNGVNVFPADSFAFFSSDGACVVMPDPVVRRIDRAP
jgi:hypothetical protein